MHSSRMRTGRSLTVCRSLLPGGGGCVGVVCLLRGGLHWGVSASWGDGVCLLGRCVCSGGGVCSGEGGVCSGGVSALGGCLLPGGVCLLLGGGIPACTETDTSPCEQNDKQVQKYYLGDNFVAAGKN